MAIQYEVCMVLLRHSSQGLYLYSKVGMGLGCGTAYVVVISRQLLSISKGVWGFPPHIIIRHFDIKHHFHTQVKFAMYGCVGDQLLCNCCTYLYIGPISGNMSKLLFICEVSGDNSSWGKLEGIAGKLGEASASAL